MGLRGVLNEYNNNNYYYYCYCYCYCYCDYDCDYDYDYDYDDDDYYYFCCCCYYYYYCTFCRETGTAVCDQNLLVLLILKIFAILVPKWCKWRK